MVIKHKTLLSFTLQWKKFLILTGNLFSSRCFSSRDLFSHSCYKCYYSRKFVKKNFQMLRNRACIMLLTNFLSLFTIVLQNNMKVGILVMEIIYKGPAGRI